MLIGCFDTRNFQTGLCVTEDKRHICNISIDFDTERDSVDIILPLKKMSLYLLTSIVCLLSHMKTMKQCNTGHVARAAHSSWVSLAKMMDGFLRESRKINDF